MKQESKINTFDSELQKLVSISEQEKTPQSLNPEIKVLKNRQKYYENIIFQHRHTMATKFTEDQIPFSVQIYSDGSCDSNTFEGGFSYFVTCIGQKNKQRQLLFQGQGALKTTTSNQAELRGVYQSLLATAEIFGYRFPNVSLKQNGLEQQKYLQVTNNCNEHLNINQFLNLQDINQNDKNFEITCLSDIRVFTDSQYVLEGFARDFQNVQTSRWRKGNQHKGIRYRNLWTRSYLIQQFFGQKLTLEKIKSKSTQGHHLECDLIAQKMMRLSQQIDNKYLYCERGYIEIAQDLRKLRKTERDEKNDENQ